MDDTACRNIIKEIERHAKKTALARFRDDEFITLDREIYDMNSLLEIIPICRSSIYNEIKAGRLKASKLRNRTIFLAPDIKAWLKELRTC